MKQIYFRFDKELHEQLQLLSVNNETNLFTVLLSAFRVLLYRYNNQEDIYAEHITDKYAGRYTIALPAEANGTALFTHLLTQVKDYAVVSHRGSQVAHE